MTSVILSQRYYSRDHGLESCLSLIFFTGIIFRIVYITMVEGNNNNYENLHSCLLYVLVLFIRLDYPESTIVVRRTNQQKHFGHAIRACVWTQNKTIFCTVLYLLGEHKSCHCCLLLWCLLGIITITHAVKKKKNLKPAARKQISVPNWTNKTIFLAKQD